MRFFLIALLLQVQLALPQRGAIDNPADGNPVPKQLQKDYDKLWKRFLTGKEDAKVFSDLDKVLRKNSDVVPFLMVQAYLDLYNGRSFDAERRLQSVLLKRPADPLASYFLAEFAYSRGDYGRAYDLYSSSRAAGSSIPGFDQKRQRSLLLAMETLLQDARRALGENRLLDAEHAYRRAIQLAPGEAALHGQYAELLRRARRPDEAEAELRLQRLYSGPAVNLVASDNELVVAGLEDLGRWGNQIEHFREIRSSQAITREQLAALLTRYFPQLTEFRHSREVMTDLDGSWAESAIQTVVGAGLLDPTVNHAFQPARIVSRGEFATVVSRLTRLFSVSGGDSTWISPLDVVPDSTLYRELEPVLSYGLLLLDNAGNFNIAAPVSGEEAVNTAEKLLRLIQKKAA